MLMVMVTIEAPIWILPSSNNSVVLEMGYGRVIEREVDRTYIDEGVLGYNALSIKDPSSYFDSIKLSKLNKNIQLHAFKNIMALTLKA